MLAGVRLKAQEWLWWLRVPSNLPGCKAQIVSLEAELPLQVIHQRSHMTQALLSSKASGTPCKPLVVFCACTHTHMCLTAFRPQWKAKQKQKHQNNKNFPQNQNLDGLLYTFIWLLFHMFLLICSPYKCFLFCYCQAKREKGMFLKHSIWWSHPTTGHPPWSPVVLAVMGRLATCFSCFPSPDELQVATCSCVLLFSRPFGLQVAVPSCWISLSPAWHRWELRQVKSVLGLSFCCAVQLAVLCFVSLLPS